MLCKDGKGTFVTIVKFPLSGVERSQPTGKVYEFKTMDPYNVLLYSGDH